MGIGLRLAGQMAGKRMAASAQSPSSTPALDLSAAAKTSRAAGQTAGRASSGLVRGVRGFLRPFTRVGGILWLEVSGVFFFLPVVVFAPTLWRVRASWLRGAEHNTFLVTAAVMVIFLYLSVTSFWRASRK